jgi:hypothetical protein
MDKLVLPQVAGNFPATEILGVMKQAERSAVVVDSLHGLKVITLEAVISHLGGVVSKEGTNLQGTAADIAGDDVLSTTSSRLSGWISRNDIDVSLHNIFRNVAPNVLMIPTVDFLHSSTTLISISLGSKYQVNLATIDSGIVALPYRRSEMRGNNFSYCVVVTRHEGIKALYARAPHYCECDSNGSHVKPRSDCRDGEACDWCGATMRCS